jgi:FkbM family methyltransferase
MGLRENRRAFRNWYALHLLRRGWIRRDYVLHTRSGLRVSVRPGTDDARITKSIFAKQRYTNELVSIPGNGIVVDVGANIGAFSLFAAERTRSGGHVFALEPEPANYRCLTENFARNTLSNVTPYAIAIAAESGRQPLALASSGSHSLLGDPTAEHIEVATRSLPDWMLEAGLERIDFLKLDCEGSEIEIIEQLDPATARRIAQIALEFHPRSGRSREDVANRLTELGFEVQMPSSGFYVYARR